MRKGENQKLKMLYLLKIFSEETDEAHGLSLKEITALLEGYGVNADRKTLYQDFEELRHYGLDIIAQNVGKSCIYSLGSRRFELPELKLLVDSVQSAKFITDKKSDELIRKLENLGSRHEAKKLHRQVIITGRVKTANEKIYYNVDTLHEAIAENRQIRFQYFNWNEKKELVLRRGGEYYRVSPWMLMWDDENYYLVAYDEDSASIRHYRVDKMLNISVLEEKRIGQENFKAFDSAKYASRLFGMFGGEEMKVRLEVKNELAGVIIDRFGKDIFMVPGKNGSFRAEVSVNASPQFLGWIIGLGGGVRILSPDSLREEMKAIGRRLLETYGG